VEGEHFELAEVDSAENDSRKCLPVLRH
jgi:hypothetical protein